MTDGVYSVHPILHILYMHKKSTLATGQTHLDFTSLFAFPSSFHPSHSATLPTCDVNKAGGVAEHKIGVHRFILVLVLVLVLVCPLFVCLTTKGGKRGRGGRRGVEDSEDGVKEALSGRRDGGR